MEEKNICKNCECPSHCTGGQCPNCEEAGEYCNECICVDCDGSNVVK